MLGKIEFHKPTQQDKRRRACFWLAVGNFLASTFLIYLATFLVAFLTVIILIIKLINNT